VALEHLPLNPAYGAGVYRRRLRFFARPTRILATLDDTHHAMWIALDHDGARVTAVDGLITRRPATPCNDAFVGLSALVGLELDASAADRAARLPLPHNCMHLTDLSRWALHPGHRATPATQYDITVPDGGPEPTWIEIAQDGTSRHRWLVHDAVIRAPEPFSGQALLGKFSSWARATFAGLELEAAMMLQRGVFVARALPYVVDPSPPIPLRDYGGMEGACVSYSGENWRTATGMTDFVEDFTQGVSLQRLPAPIARYFELEQTL
jgi:hypothetical protein